MKVFKLFALSVVASLVSDVARAEEPGGNTSEIIHVAAKVNGAVGHSALPSETAPYSAAAGGIDLGLTGLTHTGHEISTFEGSVNGGVGREWKLLYGTSDRVNGGMHFRLSEGFTSLNSHDSGCGVLGGAVGEVGGNIDVAYEGRTDYSKQRLGIGLNAEAGLHCVADDLSILIGPALGIGMDAYQKRLIASAGGHLLIAHKDGVHVIGELEHEIGSDRSTTSTGKIGVEARVFENLFLGAEGGVARNDRQVAKVLYQIPMTTVEPGRDTSVSVGLKAGVALP